MPAGSGAARGDAISVYWPLDKTWYHGRIESFDAGSGECGVRYDDGERHLLNLLMQTKYKVTVKHGVHVLELIDVVRADHGHVCKQLRHIGDALGSLCEVSWFGRLRCVKTCEDLVSCVEESKNKAVDWKKAPKLFFNSDESCEGNAVYRGDDVRSDTSSPLSIRSRINRNGTIKGLRHPHPWEEQYLCTEYKRITEEGPMSEQVKDGRFNRVRRNVKQERFDHGDTNAEGIEPDAEVGRFQEVEDKGLLGQKGTAGRAGMKKNSRAQKGRRGIQSEDDRAVNSSEENVQPRGDSSQPKNAKRSRRTKRGMTYWVETNSEDKNSEGISGEAEKATLKEKRGQKAKQRTVTASEEPESVGDVDDRSRLTRSAKSTGSGANPKSRKSAGRLRRVKEDEVSEEEGLDEGSSEAAGSDCPMSGSSEDLERKKLAKTATRASLPKRKSDESDRGFEKKARRQGHGPGVSGPRDITRSSLKARSESDEDFVIEGCEGSMSEDDEDITDEDDDDASGDSSSRENVKPKYLQKGKGLERKEKSPEDEDSSDEEEVCSVCEFAGAANLMLLCDGENCDQAFHSFCLKFPLQTIPEGDWLCPLCLFEMKSKEMTGTAVKRTPKLRARLIPPLKKVEAIIGFREDPSVMDDDNQKERNLQYLVKWCSLSHRHDTWVPEEWLLFADRTRLATYQRKSSIGDGEELSDERRPEWVQIDRVIACRDQDRQCITSPAAGEAQGLSLNKREYLVKWTNIEYNGSTWEEENSDDDMKEAIAKFFERHELAERKACTTQADRDVAHAITEQPKYISGGVLHGYQLQGLKWLLSNFQQRKSVILADEMGLGKTIQAVSFIMALKHENLSNKPVLVIGPKSTLVGWEQECRQWGADLNSVIYQGEKESRTMIRNHEFYTKERIPLFDVLVTSYDLAMLDNSLLAKFDWSCIIVDEGHRVKNTRSKLGILLRRQTTDFRLLLTGTPVQNTLTELFALLHFLDPSEFPDPERSALEFAQVDALSGASSKGEGGVEQQISRLHELLAPRMLRRLKADVMQGMIPGKKYVEVMCALTPYQRHLYGAILKKNYKQLNRGNTTGKKRSLNFILMDLKMVCNHPYLFPGKEPEHGEADELFKLLVTASGKLQFLEKLLPRLKDGGHRVLLFSQMTTMLDILEDFLSHMNFKFCRIDGTTVASERQKQIAEFNSTNSDLFIFLISTRAGGLGINLPSADTVIIYDPDFNPFVDLQAQARAHRIGQENVVLVYQLITKCSVEEKIIERSRQKLAMENLVMSKDAKDTAADVNTLLLHGARKVLEEHDVEATSVKWTEENIEALLSRDISETRDAKEGGAGYLGAVQGSGGVLGGVSVDKSPVKTGREWDDLLGKMAEQDMEAEEAKLGRGKRERRRIQYHFEPKINADEDEDEAHDGVEDDPSCSGESASLSESDSDVSLDDEKGRGVRAPYLSKVKSMKEEQVVSSPIPQQYPGPLPTSSPSIFTAPLTSPKHLGPSNVVPLPSYLPSNPNQSGLTQPMNRSPSLSYWPTSSPPPTKLTAVSSSTQSPGLSHAHFPASHPLASPASPGSALGSKPYWEYSAPRPSGSSMASVSTSQAHMMLKSPLSSPREHPNPSQVHGSPMPYKTAASQNFSQRASPNAGSGLLVKITSSPKSTHQGTSPNTLKMPLSAPTGMHQGTSPKALKVTAMSKSVQQGTRPASTSSGPTVVRCGTVQGSFLQQSKEQPCPSDYLSFAEVLRRTGSQLSGSQVSSTSNVLQDAKGLSLGDVLRQTGSPLTGSQVSPGFQGLREAKDLSLEDVLRQTGSSLTASKHVLTSGTSSQLYEETKNMSLEDVLRRTGATNMRIEDVHKRKGSIAPGTHFQLLQNSTNLSLEEVLRQTGSKLVAAPKKDMLPKPPVLAKNVPKLVEPLGDLNLKGSSSTESKQAKSGSVRQSPQVSLDTKSNSSDAVS